MTSQFRFSAQISFNSRIRSVVPAVFVTLWMLWTAGFAQASTSSCQALIQHSQLGFDEKKSLLLLSRLDRKATVDAENLLVSQQAEAEVIRLQNFYLFLRKQEVDWGAVRKVSEKEMKYIQAAAKPGFEFVRKGDAEDVSLYRRNEVNDILYRIEDRMADIFAQQNLREFGINESEWNSQLVALALREFNALSLVSSMNLEPAVRGYRLFTARQISGLIEIFPETSESSESIASADRGWTLDSKRRNFLGTLGFDFSDSIAINSALKKGVNRNRCCMNSCRSCTKHRSLKNSLGG